MLAGALHLSQPARVELERAARRRTSALPPAWIRSTLVTFLFANVEGAVSRWEASPDETAAAVARYHDLIGRTIERHGGYVFSKSDDELCAVFPGVKDAAVAAIEAQRALASQDSSAVEGSGVRMALHTGTAEARRGDYVGTARRRVSRLLDIAHGGQILVSTSARDMLEGDLPEDACLQDLGPHRMRDLAQSETVFQLTAPGLGDSFPLLRSLESLPNNLPIQVSSFVGRDNDVAEAERLIAKYRLVTLLGAGGVGKTRIALHVAAEVLDRFSAGVWFVDFASLADPTLAANAIAAAFGALESRSQAPLEMLVTYLKKKRLLLILDNCEHLVEHVARAADAILQRCPHVHILATSREALSINGERAYRVPSLSVPSPADLRTLDASAAIEFGAIALFVDRASATDSDFALTDQLAPVVAEICRRLDGIALAIELAAARLNAISVATLAERLNERFSVLTGGSRTALPRHKTMRALIDWSYDLLSEKERLLFRRLAIFAGGFTLELATTLCAMDEALAEAEVLDLLSCLVAKSLVQIDARTGVERYRLLESMRQYAFEKLAEDGDLIAVARAHAISLAAIGERFDSARELIPDQQWMAQIKPEVENWRAALEWAFGLHGDPLVGQRLAGLRGVFWFGTEPRERLHWIRVALQTCDAQTPPRVRAKLELEEARIAEVLGPAPGEPIGAAAARAAALYTQADDPLGLAEAQLYQGAALMRGGRTAEGEKIMYAVLALAQSHDAHRLIALATHNLALSRNRANDVESARTLHHEALMYYRSAGCYRSAARQTHNLAEAEFHAGEAETALRLASRAADALRPYGRWELASVVSDCSAYSIALARFDEGRKYAREAMVLAEEGGFDLAFGWALQHLAAISALSATTADRLVSFKRAAALLGFVDSRFSNLRWTRQNTEQQEYDKVRQILHDEFGAALDEYLNAGSKWTDDEAVAAALGV